MEGGSLWGSVNLNVGGVTLSTARETLCRDPNSMLASMFSGRFPIVNDENGKVFIDRDGERFRHGTFIAFLGMISTLL